VPIFVRRVRGTHKPSRRRRTCRAIGRVFVIATLSLSSAYGADDRDCDPKIDCATSAKRCVLREDTRDCTSAVPPCVRQTDTRDCEPPFACPTCDWFDVGCIVSRDACASNREIYRKSCEGVKAAQNAAYAAQFAACREAVDHSSTQETARAVANCENERDANNKLYASEFSRCQSEMALVKAECERNKVRLREECDAGLRAPFSCNAAATMSRLSRNKVLYVDLGPYRARWLTSPPSAAEGWLDTSCMATGSGVPYRDAVLSSDGFWTIDVQLDTLRINDSIKPPGTRYMRVLIRPKQWGGGRAHIVADEHYITTRDHLKFAGPVVIEHYGDVEVLEIQPIDAMDLTDGGVGSPSSPK
jgi:hypothetical protein